QVALDAARKIEKDVPADFLKNHAEFADGFMPTALYVLIRFGKWQEILAEPEPAEWRLLSRAQRHFARAVALANLDKTDEARAELELLDKVAGKLTDKWKMGNNPAKEIVAIARTMALGEIAFREGKSGEAFKLLRQAVAMEEQLRYDEPPGWMQPVRHALGALLLADQHPKEAEEVYRADLLRHPGNAWSLLGLQQALEQQGKKTEAKELEEKVRQAWARADVMPVASCYCHPDARKPNPKK
ncbi:MAG: hypothetical protein AB7K24_29310, partial [Gemmataceae bacterium]